MTDDQDSTSIFGKVIGRELSYGSFADVYSLCKMDFASNVVRTKAPYFVELGLPDVNTSDEVYILGTPDTRIRRPTYVSHWYAPDHVFGEETAFGMGVTRSEQDYSYKTYFRIWR